jgi:hypothetical protein
MTKFQACENPMSEDQSLALFFAHICLLSALTSVFPAGIVH